MWAKGTDLGSVVWAGASIDSWRMWGWFKGEEAQGKGRDSQGQGSCDGGGEEYVASGREAIMEARGQVPWCVTCGIE